MFSNKTLNQPRIFIMLNRIKVGKAKIEFYSQPRDWYMYTRERTRSKSQYSKPAEIFENVERFAARFLARSRLQPQSQGRKCWCFYRINSVFIIFNYCFIHIFLYLNLIYKYITFLYIMQIWNYSILYSKLYLYHLIWFTV